MNIGKSIPRVDAFDKVTGRAKYTDDLAASNALIVKIHHANIAHGLVKSIDTSKAEAVPGVVKVLTCFDVPTHPFPTTGHPWSLNPEHQDVLDRFLLTKHVCFYGDDVAAVIAESETAATIANRLIEVEYEELPFVLDPEEALKEGAPILHEAFPDNILGKSVSCSEGYDEAIKEEGLICVEGVYNTPIVQHCHIENHVCFCEEQAGKLVITSSTQIPHIVRRATGQALGIPWGQVRIIKPYIGGGFGNKQDVLYEPLCAFCCQQVGGRLVKLDVSREETFVSNRVRHALRFYIKTYVRPDGQVVARSLKAYSNQGGYASHGHSIGAKAATGFKQLYSHEIPVKSEVYTVFTNCPVAGAMRGYGIPQVTFAVESHMDDVAKTIGMEPLAFRKLNKMRVGFHDDFYEYTNTVDSLGQCLEKGSAYIDYEKKYAEYQNQTGPIRKGIGMSMFWYNTAVWPISLEVSGCRMVLNQDGSLQLQLAETEIGQGADTVFTQIAADVVGVPLEKVHILSTQDTDVTPYGLGAYASRQTYIGSMAIRQCGLMLRDRIFSYVEKLKPLKKEELDLIDGVIENMATGEQVMTLEELALNALYSMTDSQHLTAETTYQLKSNALSLGCCFAEVTVDIPLCKVTIDKIVNVHDCGKLINPALAEAQVHGGMSMGIGFGLSEELKIDKKTGRVLNGNLLDYKLSSMMDHPDLAALFVENEESSNAFGIKSLGEPPATPVAPAIRNAVLQATGVAVNDAPLSPHNLFEAFTKAGLL